MMDSSSLVHDLDKDTSTSFKSARNSLKRAMVSPVSFLFLQ